jgi:FMN-dependent NADH-azoreductase
MNHGKGLAVAASNTRQYAAEWIAKYKEAHPDVTVGISQLPLM